MSDEAIRAYQMSRERAHALALEYDAAEKQREQAEDTAIRAAITQLTDAGIAVDRIARIANDLCDERDSPHTPNWQVSDHG